MRKIPPILLLCVLLLGLHTPARAYADLPQDHWAHSVMTQAADMGLLTGGEDGTMQPEMDLTWGQWLTLLGRAFYPDLLTQHPSREGEHWAGGAYRAALSIHVVELADFLPVSPQGLDLPITRQDTAVLISRTLLYEGALTSAQEISDLPFPDFATLPEPYRAGVLQCVGLGLITDKEGGRFAGGDTLTRAEGAALAIRALSLEPPEEELPPPPPDESAPPQEPQPPQEPTPPEERPPVPPVNEGGPLRELDSNSEKLIRLYGTDQRTRFSSKEEADSHMTTVTVPVWRLNKSTGEKSPSELSFPIHTALAEDMEAIFTEIFQDPEQFPIYSIGGYQWRGTSGEHNCGTALDINYIENYQIQPDGRITAGECWLPGENPFSIPEDGSVVRIFNAYGYSWGGNAWPSYSNKDYMHFSYLGR